MKQIIQNRHEPGEAAETAAIQQRGRDRVQLRVRGADLPPAQGQEELQPGEGGASASDLKTL